jgi:hypothetical protein
MLLQDLTNLSPTDKIYMDGISYTVQRVVGQNAYVKRSRKIFMVQPEGSLFTVSPIVGERALPWIYCGALHHFPKIELYPGLED